MIIDSGIVTGSLLVQGPLTVSGSLSVTDGITGSLQGTASYASIALTASYASNVPLTASYANTANTASYAISASYLIGQSPTASYALTASYVTLSQTASYVQTAQTASYVATSQTASYVLQAVSASYATNALNAQTSSYVATAQTASYVLQAVSASYATNTLNAQTASYANNFTVGGTLTVQTVVAQTITSSTDFVTGSTRFGSNTGNTHQFTGSVSVSGSFAVSGSTSIIGASGTTLLSSNADTLVFTGSLLTSGSIVATGSLSILGGITGSLLGTASYASTALSASYWSGSIQNVASASYALTASYSNNATSASYATNALSASYWSGSIINAATASYVATAKKTSNGLTWGNGITSNPTLGSMVNIDEVPTVVNSFDGSYPFELAVNITQAIGYSSFSSSIATIDSAQNVRLSSLETFTASYSTGSFTGSFTGSLRGTSSYATTALTASYASNVPVTASYALTANSASYALTASYISGSGAGVGFPFSGSAIITGSLYVSSSFISGSFKGDGSQITGLTAGGKIHTQSTAASTWTVSHNLGVQYPNVTVYNASNEIILPQTITATDSNTLVLTFGASVSGYAVAGIGGIINVQGRTTQQYFTAATTWSFAHNLGDKYVSIQAFDDAFEMMIPSTIRLVDYTSSVLLFESASSGYAVATIGGDLPAISSSYAGYTLQVASSAPYSASWVAVPNVTVTNAVTASYLNPITNSFIILSQVSSSLNFVDDTAAAAGGVPLGGLYRNGNFILIRLS
jgi:hypothetical protein